MSPDAWPIDIVVEPLQIPGSEKKLKKEMSYNRLFQFGSQVLSKMVKCSVMKNGCRMMTLLINVQNKLFERKNYIYRNQEAYVYEVQKGHDRPIYIKAQYTAKIS